MSGSKESTADVVEAYEARGFKYIARMEDFLSFEGALETDMGDYACRVYMRTDFTRPPSFILKEIPAVLTPIAPHIGPAGDICYLASSTIALNPFDPVGQMLACLMRAKVVLEQILRGEAVADLADEFFSYWGEDSFLCYFDIAGTEAGRTVCLAQFQSKNGKSPVLFVTDDEARTKYKAAAIGYNVDSTKINVAYVQSKVAPAPSLSKWPVASVGEFLQWQRYLDKLTGAKVEAKIRSLHRAGSGASIIVVDSPSFSYSTLVLFDDEFGKILGLPTGISLLSQPVVPLLGYRIDERYIRQRNIPGMTTLAGKNIAIVGCGTIGGYLADLLVKAGAGTGGGTIRFVDYEHLHSQNLGRHLLGFPYLARNKALGLAHYFAVNYPDANTRGLSVDARQAKIHGADLLIDATADEALGSLLIKKYGSSMPILSVWIEGPGVAVRAMLRPTANDACPCCLRIHNQRGCYRTTVEEMPSRYAGQGCEQEYVPFPASISLQAACLASDMLLDWVNGECGPTLRTRLTNRSFTSATLEATPEQVAECPACAL